MFSKACEYGIKAVVYIAHRSQEGNRVSLKEIAKEIDSPEAFTAKIMQQLAKKNIVSSSKGPTGGFEMDEEARLNINIKSIVEVIDGDALYIKCGLGLKDCDDSRPCPVHQKFKKLRDSLCKIHTESTIEELAQKLNDDAILK
ncbi:MAG: Rrf2 family transcriptional regulator [Saprospiraceae bacterium]